MASRFQELCNRLFVLHAERGLWFHASVAFWNQNCGDWGIDAAQGFLWAALGFQAVLTERANRYFCAVVFCVRVSAAYSIVFAHFAVVVHVPVFFVIVIVAS